MELGHHAFTCHISAPPARVWWALTDPQQTPAYLYGLALTSTWTEEAPLDATHPLGEVLNGQVLCARPDERLSYVLQSGPDDPPVYLTWLITPGEAGCTLTLHVDELDGTGEGGDAEAWQLVLARLQDLLAPT